MENLIQKTTWQVQRLSAVEAELLLHVQVDRLTSAAELRGRLHGPRCPGVTTMEVAYPFRRIAASAGTLTARVVIPEPNLWTEQTPFVYEGVVELWDEGQCRGRANVSIGLKSA